MPGGPARYAAASRANALRNEGRSSTVYGAAARNATSVAPRIASEMTSREGRAAGVIQHAASGITTATAALYFVAPARPTTAPASANVPGVARSWARSDSTKASV